MLLIRFSFSGWCESLSAEYKGTVWGILKGWWFEELQLAPNDCYFNQSCIPTQLTKHTLCRSCLVSFSSFVYFSMATYLPPSGCYLGTRVFRAVIVCCWTTMPNYLNIVGGWCCCQCYLVTWWKHFTSFDLVLDSVLGPKGQKRMVVKM